MMQINKVYSVKTIDRVAAELAETIDRVFDLAIDMETEDSAIWSTVPATTVSSPSLRLGSKTCKSSSKWTAIANGDLAVAYAGLKLPISLWWLCLCDTSAFGKISEAG